MGPAMNYVSEKRTDAVDLLVSLFEGDGRCEFTVPADDERVPVVYESAGGRHTVTIGRSTVKFNVRTLGEGEVRVNAGSA
jgi:hypothetical protein